MWTVDLSLLKNQKPPLKTLKCSWGNQSFSSRFDEYKLNSLIQTYKQILLHILYCIQNQFKTHLASETKTIATNWAFSFFLNHQLPCFALEVLGRLPWRRVFLVHKSMCLCLSPSGPNSFHYQSINETVHMHLDCTGALAPHWLESNCRSLVQCGPSLRPDRHKDTWASQTMPTI